MNLILKTTSNCNLRCRYCSIGDKKNGKNMSRHILLLSIKKVKELMQGIDDKNLTIILHGGEPTLLNPELYDEAFEYAKTIMPDINLRFNIQTNGTLIDDEYIKLFKKWDSSVGISIDGTKVNHDSFRVNIKGEPTFDIIDKNIDRLKENSIKYASLMVQNDFIKDGFKEIVDYLVQKDMDIRVNPVMSFGEAKKDSDYLIQEGNYADFVIGMFDYIMEKKIDLRLSPVSDMVNAVLNDKTMGECTFSSSCCKSFICITENGDIYPCGRLADINYLKLGNINEISLLEAYNNEGVEDIRKRRSENLPQDCKDCEYVKLCKGGCPAEVIAVSGDYKNKSYFCKEYKKIFRYIHTKVIYEVEKMLLKKKSELEDILQKSGEGNGI